MLINKDSFSSGQIDSKLWLCRELENLFEQIDNIWIYGGWYGLTAFLLLSREKIKINKIKSFDLDSTCESIADMINENWVIKDWKFKAFTQDCNKLIPDDVDFIINTSTEHFTSLDWWNNIPKGTYVALQGNDMQHDEHVINFSNLNNFVDTFNLTETYYSGQLEFIYPDWSFTRFMVIGIK